jgi:CRISP-associated protein Cas1
MIQLPDFKEKQIVFVRVGRDADLHELKFKNENLAFYKDGVLVNQVSCHKLFALFIQGEGTFTSVLLDKLLSFGVSVFFMKRNFRVYAEVGAMAEGNYLLRNNQYHFEDNLGFAKKLIKNKCFNQLSLLKKTVPDLFKSKSKLQQYKDIEIKIDGAKDLSELLGFEGSMSKFYFSNYFKSIAWYRRMPRSKVDINNLLLDLGYTFLFNFVDALLSLHGFDTYKGIYHQLFFQRKSLTCDVMEPFRCLIDRALLKAYNLKQVDEKDFRLFKGRYVLEYDKSRKYLKLFLDTLMENKEDIFRYVKGFYFCVLNDTRDYPFFKIKC